MECNTNKVPETHPVNTSLCLAPSSRTVAANVVANVTDEYGDAIYLTGAEFVDVADTALAYLTVNPEDSTVRLTVKPDVSLAGGHVFHIIYHVKDDGVPASRCATGTLTATVYSNPDYPDVRIRICPDDGKSVNLSKYLDTVSVNTVTWTSVAPHIPITSSGTIRTDDVKTFAVHTFTYTVDAYCATGITRKVYLEPLRPERMRPLKDSVVICYLYAEALQINQLFGIEAYGDWSFDAGGYNITPYITESTSPAYNGAVIMDGKAIYEQFASGGNPMRIKVTYKSADGSCLAGKAFPITIILTPDITN
jgi:hypothetical protein